MNNLTFKLLCLHIGNTISITHPIGHKLGLHKLNGFDTCGHVNYYMGESIWQMTIQWIHDIKSMWSFIPWCNLCECNWFYQIFWRCFNPRTNKFEFVHNPYNTWSNSMGNVIKWAFNLTDLDGEIPWNLMINETNDGQCLKNDTSFALLAKVSPHMVIMFNEINNLAR